MGEVLDIQTVVSVLVKELSLQKHQIEQLRKDNSSLQKENSELRDRLSRYEHPKDSHNSSLPASKDPVWKKRKVNLREKSERKTGGQQGHTGLSLEIQKPDKIEFLAPAYCSCCGGALSEISGEEVERRQQIDIRPIVTEYRRIRKICNCSHVNTVEFPSTVSAPVCYGPNLQALVT